MDKGEERWARQGCLLRLFGYLPFLSCLSLLWCLEKKREWAGLGCPVVFHCLMVMSCPFFGVQKREREGARKRERKKNGQYTKVKRKTSFLGSGVTAKKEGGGGVAALRGWGNVGTNVIICYMGSPLQYPPPPHLVGIKCSYKATSPSIGEQPGQLHS